MPFQSSKITPKTLLHFPGRVSTAPSAAEPLLPVLIVLHQETSSPGRVGNALRALGHGLDIRRPRIGYYPIRPTAAGLKICPDWPDHVYHWHREGFELPASAELLAEGCDFPVEAFRFDQSFGFQFHPDVTYAMMHRWTTRGHARLELPGARARHHHFADRAVHDVTERAWLKAFLDGWLARVPAAMSEAAE